MGSNKPVSPRRRLAAVLAIAGWLIAFGWVVVFATQNLPWLVGGIVGIVVVISGSWRLISGRRHHRLVGALLIAGGGALVAASVIRTASVSSHVVARLAVLVVVLAIGLVAGRVALRREVHVVVSNDAWTIVAPCRHPVLLCNPRSGGGRVESERLEDLARARGIETIRLEEGDDLRQLAREALARGADCLGMAGGDGSLAIVAAVAIEAGVSFVCVPAGTRNHLAGDLALDRTDLIGALDAFGPAAERRIDYATVNDRVFLNNVSLGLYGEMVRDPRYRDDKVGIAVEILSELTTSGGEAYQFRVPGPSGDDIDGAYLIQVSNNRYQLDRVLDFGRRFRLTGGELGIVVLRGDRALDLPALVALAGAGQLTRSRAVEEWTSPALTITARSGSVWAGIDGEACEIATPIEMRVHPLGLRVRVPAENVQAAEVLRSRDIRIGKLVDVARGVEPEG